MKSWVRWGIVRDGRVQWTSEFEKGEEIFRDDLAFADHKRGMVSSLRFFNWLVGLAGVVFLLFFLYTTDTLLLLLVILFFFILFLSVGEAYAWRSLEFGTVIHEDGVLTFQVRLTETRRVFVPFDQIKKVKRSGYYIDLHTRDWLHYFRIAYEELTERGADVLIAWMKGERPPVAKEPPKLVLYSTKGVLGQDLGPPPS
jgi:hypothetical protein